MRNIVLAQRKERDELLSKTYLPRDHQEDRDVFLTSESRFHELERHAVLEVRTLLRAVPPSRP